MDQVEMMHLLRLPPVGTITAFLLSAVMAVGDWRTRRIPNYLTLGGALAGLVFQTIIGGWSGLIHGLLGLILGFALLILPYILGGMGAGDVKALAALGAWLGPRGCFSVFCYMALAGGLMGLGVLFWNGTLWVYLRNGWLMLQNIVLSRSGKVVVEYFKPGQEETPSMAYCSLSTQK